MLLLPLAAIAAAVLTAVRAAPADDPGTVVGSPELQAARGAARGAAALDNPWAPSGGSGAGGAGRSIMRLFGSGAGGGEHEYDVRSFGAKGDAFTDDTAAFQAAFDACIEGGGGDVLVPPGNYMMAGTVTVKCDQTTPHSLRGAGWSSNLLWAGDADLIVWTNPPPITVAELAISSIKSAKSVNSTALRVGVGPNVGAQRCEFDHLLFYGAGTVPNTTYTATFIGTALNLGNESDTTTIRDCIFWFVGGKGIVIGHGSEIRIEGGRIVGSVDNAVAHTYQPNTTAEQAIRNGSIGIHVTGNNGGVHVLSTDVIGHAVGMLVEDATGAGSNREIMITHATFDSDRVGLLIRDSSYVSIAGCWAASSDIAQVWLAPTAHGSQLTIAGGTIFNGGAYQHSFGIGECAIVGGCNGLIADAGTFLLTGLLIRNNKGVGVAVRSEAVKHYSITGCQLFGNGVGMDLQGQGYAVTGNVFHDNQKPNVVRIDDKGGAIIASNVGWDPSRGSGGHASRRGTKTDDAESSMMVGVADNTPSSTPETSIIAAAAPTAAAQDKYIAVWSIHEGGGCNDTAFSEITINTCVCEQTLCVLWTREASWRPKQEHAA
jgi:hypothetical protein